MTQVMSKSVDALTPSSLKLLMRIKEPPKLLAQVFDSMMTLLEPGLTKCYKPTDEKLTAGSVVRSLNDMMEAATVRPVAPVAQFELSTSLPPRWSAINPAIMNHLLSSIDLESITTAQLDALEESLTTVSYEKVRQSYGAASYLWSWVCAVCVIAGSPVACLPFEDLKTLQASRVVAAKGAGGNAMLIAGTELVRSHARSCQGAPITGRPCYNATATARRASTTDKLLTNGTDDGIIKGPNARKLSDPMTMRKLTDLQPLKFLGAGAFANVFMCRDKESQTVRADRDLES